MVLRSRPRWLAMAVIDHPRSFSACTSTSSPCVSMEMGPFGWLACTTNLEGAQLNSDGPSGPLLLSGGGEFQ